MSVSLGSLPFGLPLVKASAIEVEEQDLLLTRCRLVFGIGIIASVFLIVFARVVLDRSAFEPRLLARWEGPADLSLVISFVAAYASLYVGKPGIVRLLRTAYAVLSFNLVVGILNLGLLQPDYPPELLAGLILFIPAAVIPWRLRYQAFLAVWAVVTPPVARILGYTFHPDANAYWAVRGGPDVFWDQLLASSAGLVLLAALSLWVTRTLYYLRKSAHEAERLGNYLVERKLGQGGMAEVYLARHARMVRPSAVKVLRLSDVTDESALARFEREIELASGLTHPNTITILDFGRSDRNTFYYAMEYLEGVDLEELVQRYGTVAPPRFIHIMLQVCGSLAEAHGRGIIHRDLKPSNIFLTQRGGLYDFVKVLDFGLAKQSTPGVVTGITQVGQVFGTPTYMSPEQWRDAGAVDPRSDVYSFGAVAYYLLTGNPPFVSTSPAELLLDHAQTTPELPSRAAAVSLPESLDALVMKCLEKRPEDRFRTMEELEAALAAIPIEEPWTRDSARAWWRDREPPSEAIATGSAEAG